MPSSGKEKSTSGNFRDALFFRGNFSLSPTAPLPFSLRHRLWDFNVLGYVFLCLILRGLQMPVPLEHPLGPLDLLHHLLGAEADEDDRVVALINLPVTLVEREVRLARARLTTEKRRCDAGEHTSEVGPDFGPTARPWDGVNGHTHMDQVLPFPPIPCGQLGDEEHLLVVAIDTGIGLDQNEAEARDRQAERVVGPGLDEEHVRTVEGTEPLSGHDLDDEPDLLEDVLPVVGVELVERARPEESGLLRREDLFAELRWDQVPATRHEVRAAERLGPGDPVLDDRPARARRPRLEEGGQLPKLVRVADDAVTTARGAIHLDRRLTGGGEGLLGVGNDSVDVADVEGSAGRDRSQPEQICDAVPEVGLGHPVGRSCRVRVEDLLAERPCARGHEEVLVQSVRRDVRRVPLEDERLRAGEATEGFDDRLVQLARDGHDGRGQVSVAQELGELPLGPANLRAVRRTRVPFDPHRGAVHERVAALAERVVLGTSDPGENRFLSQESVHLVYVHTVWPSFWPTR